MKWFVQPDLNVTKLKLAGEKCTKLLNIKRNRVESKPE